jgi:hypothetical protein
MDSILRRRMQPIDTFGLVFLTVSVVIAAFKGAWISLLVGAGAFLIMIGSLPHYFALALLVAASVIVLLQSSGTQEGFSDAEKKEGAEGKAPADDEPAPSNTPPAATQDEGFAGRRKPMMPDNADRKEMLELGKPYKLPSEKDDKGFHLDSGTTFLNAYKALKPDQIAAMTRDTQELLATQKSLVGMLESFGPLLKDMDKITGFFGNK